jgi:hypothetical protein
MVPLLDGTNNPRSGVFLMVKTPDFRNRFQFYELPYSRAFDEVYDRANSVDETGLRTKR